MRKLIMLLSALFFIVVASYAASPPAVDEGTATVAVQQDGAQLQSVDYTFTAEMDAGHSLAVSVDQLSDEDSRMFASLSPSSQTEDTTTSNVEEDGGFDLGNFLKSYWLELLLALMAFIKVIVNLTPTTKDNQVFGWIDSIFNAIIPNYAKGGGVHS